MSVDEIIQHLARVALKGAWEAMEPHLRKALEDVRREAAAEAINSVMAAAEAVRAAAGVNAPPKNPDAPPANPQPRPGNARDLYGYGVVRRRIREAIYLGHAREEAGITENEIRRYCAEHDVEVSETTMRHTLKALFKNGEAQRVHGRILPMAGLDFGKDGPPLIPGEADRAA